VNTVDGLCRRCGKPVRWSACTDIVCDDCRHLLQAGRTAVAYPAAGTEARRQALVLAGK